jgi:hypothetical protein
MKGPVWRAESALLRLRPLTVDDEAEARGVPPELPGDRFTFMIGFHRI